MFLRLGKFVCRRRRLVLLFWLAAVALLRVAAPPWSEVAVDGDFDQLPEQTTTARATKLRSAAFPDDTAASQLVLVFARNDGPLSATDREFGYALASDVEGLAGLPLVDEIWTEKTPVIGPLLGNASGHAQRIVARLTNDFMATDNMRVLRAVAEVVDRRQADAPAGLELGVSGSAAIGGDMLTAAADSLRSTHVTTIALVTCALTLIYRSPWLVAIPLTVIAAAATASVDLLALAAQWSLAHPNAWPSIRIFTTTKVFVVVLLFGAGTDYCLFLIARFRELLAEGLDRQAAVAEALGRVGTALAASALTTVVGLAMMGAADFGKLAYSGPAIAISLLVGLFTCVTLAPALMSLQWRQTGPQRRSSLRLQSRPLIGRRIWERLARRVVRRPGLVLAASLAVAAPIAWLGATTRVSYDVFSELPPTAISRRGTALLQRHFPLGEAGPLTLFAHLPGAQFETNDGRFQIASLAKLLDELPGVDKVRSLYRPTGAPTGAVSVFSSEGISELTAAHSPLAEAAFVAQIPPYAGEVTRMTIVLKDEPFSAAAVATVAEAQAALRELQSDAESPWHGAVFELLGPTSGVMELEQVTTSDRRKIQWLVTAAVLAVLIALLRRPMICCYLIATVLLSYLVTLGAVELLFQTLYGDQYQGLSWKTPLFLFVILIAVGQDYNVYLVTRVFEEQRRLGPIAGLRRAMVQTGGIITSCGVVMAGAFASMSTGSLRGMVELGVALALGILLDTFVVRTVLVPAFLAMLARREAGRRNIWIGHLVRASGPGD